MKTINDWLNEQSSVEKEMQQIGKMIATGVGETMETPVVQSKKIKGSMHPVMTFILDAVQRDVKKFLDRSRDFEDTRDGQLDRYKYTGDNSDVFVSLFPGDSGEETEVMIVAQKAD